MLKKGIVCSFSLVVNLMYRVEEGVKQLTIGRGGLAGFSVSSA